MSIRRVPKGFTSFEFKSLDEIMSLCRGCGLTVGRRRLAPLEYCAVCLPKDDEATEVTEPSAPADKPENESSPGE